MIVDNYGVCAWVGVLEFNLTRVDKLVTSNNGVAVEFNCDILVRINIEWIKDVVVSKQSNSVAGASVFQSFSDGRVWLRINAHHVALRSNVTYLIFNVIYGCGFSVNIRIGCNVLDVAIEIGRINALDLAVIEVNVTIANAVNSAA